MVLLVCPTHCILHVKTRLELLHVKFFLHVYVVPVMVQVNFLLLTRFGQYVHLFLFRKAFLIRLGLLIPDSVGCIVQMVNIPHGAINGNVDIGTWFNPI